MRRHRTNINEARHAHELTFSCDHRFPFLMAERTCQWLVEAIEQARREWDFSVWAWVFMPDHAHVIIFPTQDEYDIADFRKAIKAPVARKAIAYLEEHAPEWLPRITRRRGRKVERLFWQSGGGYDRNIITRHTLRSMIDYLHDNPVRKELVLRARDWRWSSAAWSDDLTPVPLIPDRIPPDWLE